MKQISKQSYYERVTKPKRKRDALDKAQQRWDNSSYLKVRDLSPEESHRLMLLAKELEYQGRETFVRDVLQKISLMTPEQVTQFFALPMFF